MAFGNSNTPAVPTLTGENYQLWVVKMKAYLKSLGLWEIVEHNSLVPPLRADPTIAQIKYHEEERMKRHKAVTTIYSALPDCVFTKIMQLEAAKDIWDELEKQYEGDARDKIVRILTLKREFELLKMKDNETVKEYSTKVLGLINQMRLYEEDIQDYKVVEKMLISLPEKFEAKIAAIEESCNLTRLTISNLVSKLQAQEARSFMRNGAMMEEAFQARHNSNQQTHGGQIKVDKRNKGKASAAPRGTFPPCGTCKKTNHLEKDCWHKGKIQCRFCKK
ncbi:uncharacterized protein LOC125371225 [Ricinus communis]|uniref:uncharacterized protein LOC125371225 n=1 Tax=Ricinus communis TaxID=3988 RepID=UPI00201B1FED|nr:uncharacterized protein LOC125371225 [Ricinus communis]